jgi:trehalose/maltose hydrolase-like predicted phosphorylase
MSRQALAPPRATPVVSRRLPPALDRRFEAAVFDWDGTAVPDRRSDARRVRRAVESLSRAGFDTAVVTGTNLANVDGQLGARPAGPGRLYLCLNRGSEVFAVGPRGPVLLYRRTATPEEEDALTAAARLAVARLAERGLHAVIVAERLNRRKIDLIPEPAWADPPKARIADLTHEVETRVRSCGLDGLAEVAMLARAAGREVGLRDPRVTSDVKHVEIGLTDKSDSMRWIVDELARLGVGTDALLIAGDEFGPIGGLPGSDSFLAVSEVAAATKVSVGVEPSGVPAGVIALGGGPVAFAGVLEDQLRRRKAGELPQPTLDPEWTLVIDGVDPLLERAHESLLTLADGSFGTSGSPLLPHAGASPRVLATGVYDGEGAESHLLACPVWTQLSGALAHDAVHRRVLDLRAGILHEKASRSGQEVRGVRFSSVARPGCVVLRAEREGLSVDRAPALVPPRGKRRRRRGRRGEIEWLETSAAHGGVAAAANETRVRATSARFDRIGAYVSDPEQVPQPDRAVKKLLAAQRVGFERLLHEQRGAWGNRWDDADIRIEGDPELQRDVRFALFHLLASAGEAGESALGARGATGVGYRGHVFWDTDVFVLPFLAATRPAAARALLEYRVRRLPAARKAARRLQRAGARFPWESARTGRDVTPSHAHLRSGELVPILTGELEEHIVADVAWAAACYVDWTGDEEFRDGPGLDLLRETARYWASRIRVDDDGSGHIDGVIGPDEYHEAVDDNAFTNVMARWNLRRAAEAAAATGGSATDEAEVARWLSLADGLADRYDPSTGIYEQFAGFHALAPLVIAEVAPGRPVAASLLLGDERVAGAQVLKQADVLMLHHLVPEEVAPGSLQPNLDYYEPRTAHGSSLSLGIHAGLMARAGHPERAVDWLRTVARLDLDDITQTSAAGVHLAAMGSTWQALVFGFAGLRPDGDALRIEPRLPAGWESLVIPVRFRGARVRLEIQRDALSVRTDRPLSVRLGAGEPGRVDERAHFELGSRAA